MKRIKKAILFRVSAITYTKRKTTFGAFETMLLLTNILSILNNDKTSLTLKKSKNCLIKFGKIVAKVSDNKNNVKKF